MKQTRSGRSDRDARPSHARVWRLIHRFLGPILHRTWHYECEQIAVDGPFLLIANHASNNDPVLVGLASRAQPLAVVGSEHLERLGFLTRLLRHCFRLIPRSKASSGFRTVKQILRVLGEGQPVLLFAEGDSTWDGCSVKVFPATGKLAKLARTPLVTYRLQGNFQRRPRWAGRSGKGPVRGSVVNVYSPQTLAAMDPAEINAAIDRDIFVDAPETARQSGAVYRRRAPAEGLEQALFLCPSCGGIGSLETKDDTLRCTACGMQARLNAAAFFTEGPFPTIHAWDLWQRQAMADFVRSGGPDALFPGSGTLTRLPEGTARKVRFCLDLREKAIRLDEEALPFSRISGIAMVKTDRLLYTADGDYYELLAKHAILRPYLTAVQAHQTETE